MASAVFPVDPFAAKSSGFVAVGVAARPLLSTSLPSCSALSDPLLSTEADAPSGRGLLVGADAGAPEASTAAWLSVVDMLCAATGSAVGSA